jgi:phosphohistidine swiveling domain-containing protein
MSARFASLHEGPCSLEVHGQKAALLVRAAAQGERVPEGVILSASEAAALAAGDAALEARLEASLSWLSSAGAARVAVRSSPILSLPGALLTRLDVPCELQAVRTALVEVVASTRAAAAVDQLSARNLEAPEAPWCGVIVQHYVAAGDASSVGLVACTHQPTTGERGLFGEYLAHAGAEAVVSGRSTPRPLSAAAARRGAEDTALERTNGPLFAELAALVERLEAAFDEPLELELAHAHGVTWLLQVRPLVLSPRAQARVALAAIEADSPRYGEHLRRLIADGLPRLVESRLPPPERLGSALARGLAASPGVGSGVLVIDLASALERAKSEPVILARRDAVPEDVAAFRASRGVLTTSGGLTSHAAVIARGLRVPAVVGASQLRVDARQRCLLDAVDGRVLVREGDVVTLDAHRGLLYAGAITPEPAVASAELTQLLAEARKLRRVPVWVRAPHAQAVAMRTAFGLDGALALLAPGELPRVAPETVLKDVWVIVDAGAALELAAQLPRGHGLVVLGAVDDELVRGLRAVSRILAVGVHASAAPRLREAIDLVVCDSADDVSKLSISFPKIVRIVDSAADFLNAGHESGAILACEPTQAPSFALGLAAVGRAGPAHGFRNLV